MDKIFSFLSIFGKIFAFIIETIKKYQYIEEGRKREQFEIIKKESESLQKQTEILIKDPSKKDIADRMKDGSF